jgi:conjugal transfer mating pair stabilization protein TraN
MRQIYFLIVFLLTIFLALPAVACTQKHSQCVEGAETRDINGHKVFKECWKYEITYECFAQDGYKNYCETISNTPGCAQVNSECIHNDPKEGCLEYKQIYMCGNLLQTSGRETVHLNSEYTIAKDELDTKECDALTKKNDCTEVEKVCIEGAATRNINGKDVYKDCWKYESKYSCFNNSLVSDCEPLAKECRLISEKCFNEKGNDDEGEGDGTGKQCRHKVKSYQCEELAGKEPLLLQCKGIEYCVGGDCEQIKYEPNKNFGQAMSSLSALRNLQNDKDIEGCKNGDSKKCRVFKGDAQMCRINPFGTRNCCKDKGWLTDLKLASCNPEEKLLANNKDKGLCYAVGTYCSKKLKVIKTCRERKRSYCCFQSRIARIIHEQGRRQLGIGWGSASSPNCAPFTIEQLQKIDFGKIDFSELYADMLKPLNTSKQDFTPVSEGSLKDRFEQESKKKAPSPIDADGEYQNEIARRIKQHYGQ